MARILVGNVNSHGHVTASLPLVGALVGAGHTVDYLSVEQFRTIIGTTGATYLPLGIRPRTAGLGVLLEARRVLTTLNSRLRSLAQSYDLVLVDGIDATIAQLEKDLPVPVVGLSSVVLLNERVLRHFADLCAGLPSPVRFVLGHTSVRRLVARAVTKAAFGLDVDDATTAYGPQSSRLTLVAVAKAFQPHADDFERTLFLTPAPRSSPDPDFPLDRLADHPGTVVYASLGTVYNGWTGFFRTVIEAFGDTDALVVLSTGDRRRALTTLGVIPSNVIVRPYVPQTDVLARADLFLSHAGMGSVSEAIAAGVPTILTPRGADQYFNAYRMAELGAGEVLLRRDFTAARLSPLATRMLADDGLRTRLAALRDAGAEGPDLSDGVRAIEAILR